MRRAIDPWRQRLAVARFAPVDDPDGVGACAKKIVATAKFDASLGTRPLPRGFTVEL